MTLNLMLHQVYIRYTQSQTMLQITYTFYITHGHISPQSLSNKAGAVVREGPAAGLQLEPVNDLQLLEYVGGLGTLQHDARTSRL